MYSVILFQIRTGAAAARCDDSAALKGNIIDYLLEDTVTSSKLGILRTGKKSDRGFNHPVTASLLCPIKYAPSQECVVPNLLNALSLYCRFKTRTYNQLKNGVLAYKASCLPRFLYPEGQVYNQEDIEDGCFRGHLLLRVCRFGFVVLKSIFNLRSGCETLTSRP